MYSNIALAYLKALKISTIVQRVKSTVKIKNGLLVRKLGDGEIALS